MTIKAGDRLPQATFTIFTADGPAPRTTDEIFGGKTVALFAVPGAFTPTCSAKHLPGFMEHAAELKAKGVDLIACVSVNDVFVMDAWGKSQNVGDDVLMLADGNGDFTRSAGLDFDASKFGMGRRSQRYSMIVKDGVVDKLNVEAGGEFRVSAADYMLGQLKGWIGRDGEARSSEPWRGRPPSGETASAIGGDRPALADRLPAAAQHLSGPGDEHRHGPGQVHPVPEPQVGGDHDPDPQPGAARLASGQSAAALCLAAWRHWEKTASRTTHWGFYIIMIGMPLTGWLAVSASPLNLPTLLYRMGAFPAFPGRTCRSRPSCPWSRRRRWSTARPRRCTIAICPTAPMS